MKNNKTQIVATIGPSSIAYQTMKKMAQAGMDIVRINLSHAVRQDMDTIVANVKQLKKETGIKLQLMLDTRGPEIRVKKFENGKVEIKKGQQFIFSAKNVVGNAERVALNQPSIVKNIEIDSKILANDGLLEFKVEDKTDSEIICVAKNSGTLSNNKSLFIPNLKLNIKYLNDKDKEDILWAIKNKFDMVAISFVNSKKDCSVVKKFIAENNGKMKVIAKIESALGVKNLDEIISSCDGIMVARGDLGVEVAMEKLPHIQKDMIAKTVRKGKFVIVATEMMESMIYNKRPTRAEVSDVANALYDGTNAVMLSGESASGRYPVEAVKMMDKIIAETEKFI